jgi:hypothetical protein
MLPRFTRGEQRKREKAYDEGLRAVKREARRAPRTRSERLGVQERIVAAFPGFAAIALGLDGEANELLTDGFLPMGSGLARWARGFDPTLSMADTIQACRNAWTCGGIQAMELTPATIAYSLLYPYSDNYLDQQGLSTADKLQFSQRFRLRLAGQAILAENAREAAIWALVQLIEKQYPRAGYPQVFQSLLDIHQAQEDSIRQLRPRAGLNPAGMIPSIQPAEVLRITCAKGGTSVLADAYLAQPWLTNEEVGFAFEWGVLLQLGDDLQDVREDLERGSVTLFTLAAARGDGLDELVLQLLHFSDAVACRMDRLPHGTDSLKHLLRMSWRSLILMAVANAHTFFSPEFLAELETCSGFRFDFLRARNQKLDERESLFAVIFDAFLEAGEGHPSGLPQFRGSIVAQDLCSSGGLGVLSNSFV